MTHRDWLSACLGLLLSAAALAQTEPAGTQFQQLQDELQRTHKASDWQANLKAAVRLKAFLNEAPQSLLEVARAQTRLGDLSAALGQLGEFARMGQSVDLTAVSPDFAALTAASGFAPVKAAMGRNATAVAHATSAFVLPDAALLAEDIDYDPAGARFFISSVREKKIITATRAGVVADFARAPDGWPVVALKVDAAHQVLWATEVAMANMSFTPKSAWGRSALLRYDLRSAALLGRTEGPPAAALGDMTLTGRGDVLVSDGDRGGLYRVPAGGGAFERIDSGDFISPQTPAMLPDGRHVLVPDYVRGIALLDLSTHQVRWLAMQGRFALSGIDGLYFDHGRLIATQNGTSPERVVMFALDASFRRIVSQQIIERAATALDPTHGVVLAGSFYYIANSGWEALDDAGAPKRGLTPGAARIMRADLTPH
jgi:sugar lactone lactonase YvrE